MARAGGRSSRPKARCKTCRSPIPLQGCVDCGAVFLAIAEKRAAKERAEAEKVAKEESDDVDVERFHGPQAWGPRPEEKEDRACSKPKRGGYQKRKKATRD